MTAEAPLTNGRRAMTCESDKRTLCTTLAAHQCVLLVVVLLLI
jgi:hypothetical protein